HLGKLARYLRLLGFDTDYSARRDDAELVAISVGESRILLTRDRELLKHGSLTHGLLVRATDPDEQLLEIVARLDRGGPCVPSDDACPATARSPLQPETMSPICFRRRCGPCRTSFVAVRDVAGSIGAGRTLAGWKSWWNGSASPEDQRLRPVPVWVRATFGSQTRPPGVRSCRGFRLPVGWKTSTGRPDPGAWCMDRAGRRGGRRVGGRCGRPR